MGRFTVVAIASLLLWVLPAARATDAARVAPSAPSPLATTAELVERQFSPLEAYQIQRKLRTLGLTEVLGIADLSSERLLIRVPEKAAADGRYGVLVFLGPWSKARFDAEWNNVLDSHGVIFISPDNAGDDARTLERRIPMALHAYEYARGHYPVDPERIYVAGSEGGSRLALQLAVAFPDVFAGAVVNSGALELGTQALPLPESGALQRLRMHSRFVFATGEWDQPAFSEQQRALISLRTYCIPTAHVFDMTERGHTDTGQGHAALSGRLLGNIFLAMEGPRVSPEPDTATCEAALRRTAGEALGAVRTLDRRGDRKAALQALVEFDHAYGRLLPDEEWTLARELNPAFFDSSAGTSGAPAGNNH